MNRKWSNVAAVLVGLVPLSLSLLGAAVLCAYLTEYGGRRFLLAALVAALGIGTGVAAYLLVSRHCRDRRRALIAVALAALLVLVPLVSMVYPGQITYSRFGWTVYGLVPIPTLDITVGPHGGLWFRDKSHFIAYGEVQPLLSPEVEALVIGIGWQRAVQVDPAIQEIEGIEIHILATPEAFDLFNRYVTQGRRVVLIAHSTC